MDKGIIEIYKIFFEKFIKQVSLEYGIPIKKLKNLWENYSKNLNIKELNTKNLNYKVNIISEIDPDTKNIFSQYCRLGLCCLNTKLRKKNIFCSRTMIRKNFTIQKAKELAINNLKDLKTMILWNQKNYISLFRISSTIFPHFTDNALEPYDINFAKPILIEIGNLIKKLGHRVLMHPSQFNQIGTPIKKVFKNTIADLSHHADILDAMNIGPEGVLIVHGGGTYGNKELTKKRWIKQFDNLPLKVKNRLVLENCEKGYSPRDCLDICQKVNIPMVYDCFHYKCYKILHPKENIENPDDFLPEVFKTWGKIIPIMHVSEQGTGRIGHHSDYIEEIPRHILEIPEKYGISIDLEVEAKMKEQAIFKLYKKYNF